MAQIWQLRKIFFACTVACVVFAIIFEVYHMRYSDVDWRSRDPLLDADPATLDITRLAFDGFGSIAKQYFCGDGVFVGRGIFACICMMILFGTCIDKQMNFVTGVFWDALQDKDYDKFMHGLLCYLTMVPGAFLVAAYRHYIVDMLKIHWQQSLTRHLQRVWLGHSAYCVGQIRAPNEKPLLENPDQRIEVDVPEFVGLWLSLVLGLVDAIPTFCVWMPIVVQLSPEHIFALPYMPVFRPWLLVLAVTWCLVT